MAWPYRFVNLSPEQISDRRKALDLYGFYAWISPIIVLFSVYIGRLLLARISQPSAHLSHGKAPTFAQLNIRRLLWILNSPLPTDFGTLKVHLIGLVYTSWLLFLTTHQTGTDYMHFTKRLGHVAVSQLPLQYLLSVKSPLSPIQLATNLTHETLNPYHRLTGRIVHLFLLAHAILYLSFFYSISALPRRLYDGDVQLGILSITMLTTLAITALPPLRKRAYHKTFYVPHALLSFFLMPAISAHVPYTRKYILQTFILYLFNVATRKINTTAPPKPATITPVTGTNGALLHISIPTAKPTFGSPIPTHSPGQHIYLKSGHNPGLPRSPFTIVSVPPVLPPSQPSEKQKAYRGYPIPDIELVVRNLGGPTTVWLASSKAADSNINATPYNIPARKYINGIAIPSGNGHTNANRTPHPNAPAAAMGKKLTVLIEGPYGSSSTFIPSLLSSLSTPATPHQQEGTEGEEILLLAGGIGATFTLPIYVSLLQSAKAAASISKRIHFRWIVRSREEAQWGVESLRNAIADVAHEGDSARPERMGMLNVKIYTTRPPKQESDPTGLSVEEEEDASENDATSSLLRGIEIITPTPNQIGSSNSSSSISTRPPLRSLIDSILSPNTQAPKHKHSKITVLVCAPPGLTNALRKEVGRHVMDYGRDVVWHEEAFGMGV